MLSASSASASSWVGRAANAPCRVTASWKNGSSGSSLQSFAGGSTEAEKGYIFRNAGGNLNLGKYSGFTTVFYDHSGDGTDASSYVGGDTVITNAAKGAGITLLTDKVDVDVVFYNKILRAYVLIELKTTKLTPEAAGQLNMYLNYYAAEVNDEHDNPPIGIILCTDKDSIAAEYALGGLSNNIFASRYVSYIPNKEQLIAQVEAVLNEWHNSENR